MFGLFKRRGERPPSPDSRLTIAVGEAIRAIDGQQENLDNLRSRVGILLSAATIATSFLGGIALDGRSLLLFGYLAIGLFIVHIALGLSILWPRGWRFQTSPQLIVERWIDTQNVNEDRIRRRLVYWADRNYTANAARLDRLWRGYAIAIAALGLEIVAWIMELGGFQGWLCDVLCR